MKIGTFFSVMFLGVLLSSGSSMAVEDRGAESIVLKGGSGGAITFPHGRHQWIFVDCKPCHDLFAKEPQVIDRMKAKGTLQNKEVMTLCRKCHTELASQGKKTGPTGCQDCHKK
jgi:hypothetical protein